MSSTNNPKAKVARLTMLLLLLPCLLSLPLLAACSGSSSIGSSIASVDAMTLQIGPEGYSIRVLLKPHNVTPDIYYVAELLEGNLPLVTQDVMWSEDDIAAQRDAVVTFWVRELAPQVEQGTARLTSVYHVAIYGP